jgi:hypothetical protein
MMKSQPQMTEEVTQNGTGITKGECSMKTELSGMFTKASDSKPASTPVDRSAEYQRLNGLRVWKPAERLIDQERKRLRALGETRAQSGEAAWKLASRGFNTEAVLAGKALHEALPVTPSGLTVQQAVSWRLAIVILITTTIRSAKLTAVARRLTMQARLRAAMGNIGEYDLSNEAVEHSLGLLRATSESCVAETDRIITVISEIDVDPLSDELAEELTDLLDGLCIAREVLEEHWRTTGFALPAT